jgi:hypothetical protein
MTPSSLHVIDAFGEQLSATSEPTDRRRAPLLWLGAILVVALGTSLSPILGGSQATSALAIERSGDVISIRLQDATADPAKLTEELQAADIDAHVLLAPATPGAVGTWVDVAAPRVPPTGQDPSRHDTFDAQAERRLEAQRLEDIEVDGDIVRIPADYPHGLAMYAGVTPRPGQPPIYDSDGRLPSHPPPGRGE